MELRQSTERKVRIGPFLDATDGKTPETGITLGAADQAEILKANGAATVDISGATWAAVTGCDGWYDLTITTSYSDTLGHLTVVVQDVSECLPVFAEFAVVTANYWDSKYSTDKLQVDAVEISGDATAADNAELAFDGTGYGFANCVIPTVTALTGHTAQTGDSFARIGATGSALTSLAVASICTETRLAELDAANMPLALDNTYFAASSTFPIVNSGVHGNAALKALIDTIDGIVDSILSDTAEIGAAGAGLTDLGGMSSGMQTEVNNQVVDVIRTDTTSEMSQGAPPVDPTMEEMVAYLYFRLRNKRVVTETEDATYDDAGTTKLYKAAIEELSDVFTKSEYGSGA